MLVSCMFKSGLIMFKLCVSMQVSNDKYIDLFLEALPIVTFWLHIVVAQSHIRAKAKQVGLFLTPSYVEYVCVVTLNNTRAHVQEESGSTGLRAYDPALITVSNYLRVVAAVIMRGLVKCRNDRTFFKGETRGRYHREAAEKVLGLKLIVYQQLLRYMHLAATKDRPDPNSTCHDKCYFIRPLITFLQLAFARWFVPGKNNAMDEAGVPSRFRWLRNFNKDKPHKYFIEILMACCAVTKFCWHFFVNESSKKAVRNPNRSRVNRGKKRREMFQRVPHYQPEYNVKDREVQDKFGSTAAQIVYFARKLRESDMGATSDICYRVFVDRRWDNLPGIVCARRWHNVSYTATVKQTHRFHVVKKLKPFVTKSKLRKHRGKYRSATTTINFEGEDVTLTEVLWNDSSLVGCVSADLGTEEYRVTRRMGRHTPTVAQPNMMRERDKHYRAVDQNDQLRLSKWQFQHTAKRVC